MLFDCASDPLSGFRKQERREMEHFNSHSTQAWRFVALYDSGDPVGEGLYEGAGHGQLVACDSCGGFWTLLHCFHERRKVVRV